MNCSNCGAELQPGDKFCTSCGAKNEGQQQSSQQRPTPRVAPPPPPPSANSYRSPTPSPPQPSSRPSLNGNPPPVGVFKFMLIHILMVIPLINLITIFVISFKGGVNQNLKNYGRSMLIFMVIGIGLMIATGSLQMIMDMFSGGNFF